MSIVEPTMLSLARASGVAALTLMLLVCAGPAMAINRRYARILFWAALIAFLAPAMPGLFLLNQKMRGTVGPDAFLGYEFRVWLRYAPLALLPMWMMPPPVSASALQWFHTGAASSCAQRFLWRVRAFGRGLWVGIALVFLFAFQEFEMATTWNVRSWTVALFDAQVGGLALSETLRLAVAPLIVQFFVLGAILLCLRPAIRMSGGDAETEFHAPIFGILGLAIFMCLPTLVVVVSALATAFIPGMLETYYRIAPWHEIWNGMGLAIAATVLAWPIGGWIAARRGWRFLLLVPGLLGPLVCGLGMLAILQAPGLESIGNSVFAPVLGLVLAMLPYAALVQLGLSETTDHSSLHIARGAGAAWALWKLQGWPRLVGMLLLFFFAYTDFTINSLLAPPQFVSASVRLLNLLHYGYSPSLLGMFMVAMTVPILAAGLTMLGAHLYARRRVR